MSNIDRPIKILANGARNAFAPTAFTGKGWWGNASPRSSFYDSKENGSWGRAITCFASGGEGFALEIRTPAAGTAATFNSSDKRPPISTFATDNAFPHQAGAG